jgi:peptide/nickel transport system permease protein
LALKYLLNRIFWGLITLWCVSLVTFGLSKCSANDPELVLAFSSDDSVTGTASQQEALILDKARRNGVDKPTFYFGISNAVLPDTLCRVFPLDRRDYLCELALKTGSWPLAVQFEQHKRALTSQVARLPENAPLRTRMILPLSSISLSTRIDTFGAALDRLQALAANDTLGGAVQGAIEQLRRSVEALNTGGDRARAWWPAWHWYGVDNQYHRWIKGFLLGDLGLTRQLQRPVWQELRPALWSTLMVNSVAMLLAFLGAIPMGMYLARQDGRQLERWWSRFLIFLFVIPGFLLGALMILLFATPDTGLALIGTFSITPLQDSGKYALGWFVENTPVILLPVLTLALHTFAIVALQMRSSVLGVIRQDYIRTARAKGLEEDRVYWDHAYKNALFPIISLLAQVFPAIFVGSLVLETLFPYYGIGRKTMDAIQGHDHRMLMTILMLSSAITILGNILADYLYGLADPRVRYTAQDA